MARIRTVKPELFRHEELFEAELLTGLPLRLSFIALFTVADREGRFKWKAKQLKLDCLPYDNVDFGNVLEALESGGFIKKYSNDKEIFGLIPSFKDHQVINIREAQSSIPSEEECKKFNAHETHVHAHASRENINGVNVQCSGVNIPKTIRAFVFERDGYACVRCGREDSLHIDHIFPRSIGGTHAATNLRILCESCNCSRPTNGDDLLKDLAIDGLSMDDMKRMCMHVHAQGEEEKEGKGREKEKEREGEREERDADAPPPPEEPKPKTVNQILADFGIDGDLARDFKKHRKAKKAEITETAMLGFQREAGKAGISIQESVRIATEKGWISFDSTWNWQGSSRPQQPQQPKPPPQYIPKDQRKSVFGGDAIDSTATRL